MKIKPLSLPKISTAVGFVLVAACVLLAHDFVYGDALTQKEEALKGNSTPPKAQSPKKATRTPTVVAQAATAQNSSGSASSPNAKKEKEESTEAEGRYKVRKEIESEYAICLGKVNGTEAERKAQIAICDKNKMESRQDSFGASGTVDTVQKNCDDAIKAFNQAKTDFGSNSTIYNNDLYKNAFAQGLACQQCTDGRDAKIDYCDDEGIEKLKEEERKAKRANKQTSSTNDIDKPNYNKTRMAVCPAYSAKISSELKKAIDKHKEDQQTDEDKLAELTKDKNKIEGELAEYQAEYKKKEKEYKKERDDAVKKLNKSETEKTKKLTEEYDKASADISQLMNQVFPALQEEHRAKLVGPELACEQQAYQKLDADLAERKSHLKNNTLSAGDFLNLARQTGQTRKEKNAARADKYFQKCVEGGQYKAQIALINNEFNLKVKNLEGQLQSLQDKMMKITQEISSQERNQEYQAEMVEIERSYQDALENLRSDLQNKTQAKTKELQVISEQIKQLQIRMQQKSGELGAKQALYRAANAKGAGEGIDKDEYSKFMTSFEKLQGTIQPAWDQCKCGTKTDASSSCSNDLKDYFCSLEISRGRDECGGKTPGDYIRRGDAKK